MLKKILSIVGITVGILLVLSGLIVFILAYKNFFGTAVTIVLCGAVIVMMLFVIYIAISKILDIKGKRQNDEEIIEEQHLKNIFTNEIALKQQTMSMTAINPAIQQTVHGLEKTASLKAQKDKQGVNNTSTFVSVEKEVPVNRNANKEFAESIYKATIQEKGNSSFHTSANIWEHMDIRQTAHSSAGNAPLPTGATPAQKAAAQRFGKTSTGFNLFADAEEEQKDVEQVAETTEEYRVRSYARQARQPLNRQLYHRPSVQKKDADENDTKKAIDAMITDESATRGSRAVRRPVSRREPIYKPSTVGIVKESQPTKFDDTAEKSSTSKEVEMPSATENGETTETVVVENSNSAVEALETAVTVQEEPKEEVRRGRGRPKKEKTPEEIAAEQEPKRGRGRPPKQLTPEEIAAQNAPKRPRGRPAKVLTAEEIAAMNAPKRPRGRPRKTEVESESSAD